MNGGDSRVHRYDDARKYCTIYFILMMATLMNDGAVMMEMMTMTDVRNDERPNVFRAYTQIEFATILSI